MILAGAIKEFYDARVSDSFNTAVRELYTVIYTERNELARRTSPPANPTCYYVA